MKTLKKIITMSGFTVASFACDHNASKKDAKLGWFGYIKFEKKDGELKNKIIYNWYVKPSRLFNDTYYINNKKEFQNSFNFEKRIIKKKIFFT